MHSELKWFLLLLLGLWVAWLATGGPDRITVNRQNPFLESPTEGGNIYSLEDLRNGRRP